MIIDYSVAEPISFQVAAVESSHPIIEPRPWKPDHSSLSGDDTSRRPSNESESRGDKSEDESNAQLTLRLPPEVEFNSSVFQPPRKSSSSAQSCSDEERRRSVKPKPRKPSGDVYEFRSGNEDDDDIDEDRGADSSDTSSEDEKADDKHDVMIPRDIMLQSSKLGLNLSPTVKLEDIAKIKVKKEGSEYSKVTLSKEYTKRCPSRSRWSVELKREQGESSSDELVEPETKTRRTQSDLKVFLTRSKTKTPSQHKKSRSSSSKKSQSSKTVWKQTISSREINELKREANIQFTDGRPKRNLKPSLRKVESDMYVINTTEGYGASPRDSSKGHGTSSRDSSREKVKDKEKVRDNEKFRDKEKMSKSGTLKYGSAKETASRIEDSRERYDSKEKGFISRFKSARKSMPRSGSRFGLPSGSKSGSRETRKERSDSHEKVKVTQGQTGPPETSLPQRESPIRPKADKPASVVDKTHPIKRFNRAYQREMEAKSDNEEDKREFLLYFFSFSFFFIYLFFLENLRELTSLFLSVNWLFQHLGQILPIEIHTTSFTRRDVFSLPRM